MGKLHETETKPITDADRVRLGNELATVDRALIELKEEKSQTARAYRVRITDLEEKTDAISRQLQDGIVEHKFEVEEIPDDRAQVIAIMRVGTGELLKTRPMTEGEKTASMRRRQPELFEDLDDDDGTDREHDTERPPPMLRPPTGKKPRGRPRKNKNGLRAP